MSFVLQSLLLGMGLAMDAFSVSLANGLAEPKMKVGRMSAIAGIFAFFQALMPMLGWFFVHSLVTYFEIFAPFIPWIAFGLLGFIGGKMLFEGIRSGKSEEETAAGRTSFGMLMVQGVATSIDALSVGFTIAEYTVFQALWSALIIAAVTFIICMAGVFLGKKFGTKLAGKASILGGVILVAIGIEILVSHFVG